MQSDMRKSSLIIDLGEDFVDDILLLCLYWVHKNIPARAVEHKFLLNKFFSEMMDQFKHKVSPEVEWEKGCFIVGERGPLIEKTLLGELEELDYIQINPILGRIYYPNGVETRERLEIRITERGLDHVKRTLVPKFKNIEIYTDLMEEVIPKAYKQAKTRPKITAKRGKRRLRKAGVPERPSKGTWVIFGSQELEYPLMENLAGKGFYVLCVDSLQPDENVAYKKFKDSHLWSHFRYIYWKDKWEILKNFPKFISKQNVPEVKGIIFLEPPPFNYLEKLNKRGFRTIPSLQFARIAYFIDKALEFVGNKIKDNQIALVPTFYASEAKDVIEKLDEWGRVVVRPTYKITKENGKYVFIIGKNDIDKNKYKIGDITNYFKKDLSVETFCLQKYVEGDEILVSVIIDSDLNIHYLEPVVYTKKKDRIEGYPFVKSNHIVVKSKRIDANNLLILNNFAKEVFSPFIDHHLTSPGIYTMELIKSKDGKYYFYGELDWHIEDVQYMATYYSFATLYYDCLASAINGLQMPTIPKTERTIYSSHSIQAYQKDLFESICQTCQNFKNPQICVKKLRYKISNPSDKLAWASTSDDERKLEALIHESLLSWGVEK